MRQRFSQSVLENMCRHSISLDSVSGNWYECYFEMDLSGVPVSAFLLVVLLFFQWEARQLVVAFLVACVGISAANEGSAWRGHAGSGIVSGMGTALLVHLGQYL